MEIDGEHPSIRHTYENQVINTILNIINPSINSFHLKLGICCSGRLLGEEILLFRLLNELKQRNAQGTIEIFFIDPCYKGAVQNASHNNDFTAAVGQEQYIQQFLSEMCQCLPPGIQLKGTFFSNNDSYINLAKSDSRFRHHLLIGADIGKAQFDIAKIGKEAGFGLTPIVLAKSNAPHLCQVDAHGNLINCFDPTDPIEKSPNENKKNNNNQILLIVLISLAVLVVAGGIGIGVTCALKKKRPALS